MFFISGPALVFNQSSSLFDGAHVYHKFLSSANKIFFCKESAYYSERPTGDQKNTGSLAQGAHIRAFAYVTSLPHERSCFIF